MVLRNLFVHFLLNLFLLPLLNVLSSCFCDSAFYLFNVAFNIPPSNLKASFLVPIFFQYIFKHCWTIYLCKFCHDLYLPFLSSCIWEVCSMIWVAVIGGACLPASYLWYKKSPSMLYLIGVSAWAALWHSDLWVNTWTLLLFHYFQLLLPMKDKQLGILPDFSKILFDNYLIVTFFLLLIFSFYLIYWGNTG